MADDAHEVLLQEGAWCWRFDSTLRLVIEVEIAATSLLKRAASLGFQHLVKGEIINFLMLHGISPEVRMPSAWRATCSVACCCDPSERLPHMRRCLLRIALLYR